MITISANQMIMLAIVLLGIGNIVLTKWAIVERKEVIRLRKMFRKN